MDALVENLSPTEMLEQIAELDYSQSQLRDLNTEMSQWLDGADDEISALRSENTSLRQHVKRLERFISETAQAETEPRELLRDNFDADKINEQKIYDLEKDARMMKEQNKEVTAELKNLQQEKDKNQLTISNLRTQLQRSEYLLEEAQLALQRRDEIIHQKTMQLNYLEDIVEEYTNIIKDLRITNQEQRRQLEEELEETSLAAAHEPPGEREVPLIPLLSIAQEIELIISGIEEETDTVHTSVPTPEGFDPEEVTKPPVVSVEPLPSKQSWADMLEKPAWSYCLLGLLIFFTLVLFVASREICHIDAHLNKALLMLHPYVSVQYSSLPPI